MLMALRDDDPSIVKSIIFFLEEELKSDETLGKSTISKINSILTTCLQEKSEDAFLSLVCDLMLADSGIGSATKALIFKDPLANCDFKQLEINSGWKSQYEVNMTVPKYAETLKSTQGSQASQTITDASTTQIRATQTTLEFIPTQISGSMKKQFQSSLAPSLPVSQNAFYASGQFRVDNENFGQNPLPTNQGNEKPRVNLGNIRIGKRFHSKDDTDSGHEQSKVKFAKMHQKRETLKKFMEKERKGKRHAQVHMLRYAVVPSGSFFKYLSIAIFFFFQKLSNWGLA